MCFPMQNWHQMKGILYTAFIYKAQQQKQQLV